MSSQPLLSIVIPTKDRYDTLIPVVDSFLNHIVGNDYEIVIQDNSGDNSRWLQYTQTRQDEKIRYFYDALPVPIKDNVNRAFDNSGGEYWILIGDDDFVSPYILDVVKMMKEKGIESLKYICGRYYWKGSKFYKDNLPHYQEYAFWMPKQISTHLEQKNAKIGLKKTLLNGAINYDNLPRVYHGITKNTVLRKIKEISGEYVTGSSPDFSLCIATCFIVDTYWFVHFPVSVAGACPQSAQGLGINKKHYAVIDNIPFLPTNIKEVWNKNIPMYWTPNTIYAQTAYETLNAFKSNEKINLIPFYVKTFFQDVPIRKKVLQSLVKYSRWNVFNYFVFLFLSIKFVYSHFFRRRSYFSTDEYNSDVYFKENPEDIMFFLAKYNFTKWPI